MQLALHVALSRPELQAPTKIQLAGAIKPEVIRATNPFVAGPDSFPQNI